MVQVLLRVNTRCHVERVVFPPPSLALQNLPETRAVDRVFPALDRTTVDVWAQRKLRVAGLTNSEPVEVRDGRGEADLRGGVGGVPEGE
jgi:hypothetical protein